MKEDFNNLYKINEKVLEFYHKQLQSSELALKYLAKRKINNDAIKEFKIGYSTDNNSLYEYLKEQEYTEDDILASKLVFKDEDGNIVDRFKNRIIFPIFNEQEQVVAFTGRTINNSTPKYITTSDNMIYTKAQNLYGINLAKKYSQEYLVLTEGSTDVITLNQYGIKNVVALLGTAMTDEQAQLIKKYTNNVIIVLDSDLPGKQASLRAKETLEKIDIQCRVITLNDAKDPDEYVKKYGIENFIGKLENDYRC